MTRPLFLRPPREGFPIGVGIHYAQRTSAVRQAAHWNELLAEHPTWGPDVTGLVVVVGAKAGARWPLVWAPRPMGDPE